MESDYFSLFGLETGIEIDLADLNKKYLTLQAQFHPDKFVGKNESEKAEAMAKSSFINKAYGVLKDRFKRAEYVIGKLEADPETLMEIMELRESDEPGIIGKVKTQVDELFGKMTEDYKRGKYDDVAKKFVKIKYLNKYLEDVAANT